MSSTDDEKRAAWRSPGRWRARTWSLLVTGSIVVLVIVIVVPVLVTKRNNAAKDAYPNYTKLNYSLSETYATNNFFDNFDYFHGVDPTAGHVHYVDPAYAASYNLTPTLANSVMVKVDTSVGPSSSPDASTGRFSVRIESKRQYNRGLFLFDIKHTPTGCGTWPALWLTDSSSWPAHGEIDIMEVMNPGAPSGSTDGNLMTLHTGANCNVDVKRNMTGAVVAEMLGAKGPAVDCDAGSDEKNERGCSVAGGASTYGQGFNAAGGGLMAVEWRNEGIRMWQFGRAAVPADITAGNPNPSVWPIPLADFPNTNCDIGKHFSNASVIVNISLCGDALPEETWATSGCPTPCVGSHDCVGGWVKNNCTDFVSNNPQAFTNAYWEFGEFQIYQAA